mmetsp:Transcript_9154/g.37737  ORF Transcript_9154/g.37737 Transcript_9154/m.37737 type:complete len:273 (+) Transcript_9154:749-1567(+)
MFCEMGSNAAMNLSILFARTVEKAFSASWNALPAALASFSASFSLSLAFFTLSRAFMLGSIFSIFNARLRSSPLKRRWTFSRSASDLVLRSWLGSLRKSTSTSSSFSYSCRMPSLVREEATSLCDSMSTSPIDSSPSTEPVRSVQSSSTLHSWKSAWRLPRSCSMCASVASSCLRTDAMASTTTSSCLFWLSASASSASTAAWMVSRSASSASRSASSFSTAVRTLASSRCALSMSLESAARLASRRAARSARSWVCSNSSLFSSCAFSLVK